ncbi:Uncharacterized protein AC510_3121 [Pseudomonas amygdali pv. myricae]|nr:Uncharacterized protein AC510_3121 [Pseudomonas amygdali pv. myricae]
MSVAFASGLLLAWLVTAAPGVSPSESSPSASTVPVRAVGEEVNAGTF